METKHGQSENGCDFQNFVHARCNIGWYNFHSWLIMSDDQSVPTATQALSSFHFSILHAKMPVTLITSSIPSHHTLSLVHPISKHQMILRLTYEVLMPNCTCFTCSPSQGVLQRFNQSYWHSCNTMIVLSHVNFFTIKMVVEAYRQPHKSMNTFRPYLFTAYKPLILASWLVLRRFWKVSIPLCIADVVNSAYSTPFA